MKTLKVKLNKQTGDLYLDIREILKDTNIEIDQVYSYNMTTDKGWVRLTLYDKDGNVLEIKENK